MIYAFTSLLVISCVIIVILYKYNIKLKIAQTSLLEKITQKDKEVEDIKQYYKEQKEELKANYNEQLEAMRTSNNENLKLLKNELETNLKTQNNAILNQNKLMLNEDSKKILDDIFKPLQERIEVYSKNLIQNEASLKSNIESVFKFSQNISENANMLAKVLKGDKKIRGNFAEKRLKSILDSSGLIEGEQYVMQKSFKDDKNHYIADAVVFIDTNKSIVIDSKFSLPSNFSFDEVSDDVCKELCKNLKNRINELANKPYSRVPNAYDFILLFIPYDSILESALSVDNNLYQNAFDKKIYLTTPNTLLMALKTIHIIWQDKMSDKNAKEALEEIGRFYDKFVGVCESFDKVKNKIISINNDIEDLDKKLLNGRGNLADKFEKLKTLGAKTQKSIERE